ncbi:MAG TPA: TetR/AcrR family transcriptional regulator [Desulfotignum sp.]|nr:TetR/AcrR family transcriptional regulator [Desulfotignum sp.]
MPKKTITKPDLILDAALHLFAENGFHSAPMSRLAAMAGVGVGSIYRYFKDKDQLVHAVFKHVDQALTTVLTASFDPDLSDREQLIQMLTHLIQYLHAHPREFRFLEQYYHSPYGLEKKRAKISLEDKNKLPAPLRKFFFGELDDSVKKLPWPVYQALIFGPVTYLMRDSLTGLVTLDDDMVQSLTRSCWDALKK